MGNLLPPRIIKQRIILFYLFTFSISWTFWLVMFFFFKGTGATNLTGYFVLIPSTLGALGPLFSLKILERLTKKEVDLKKILSMAKIRVAKKTWFILAVLGLPTITVFGNLLYFLAGRESQLRLIKPGLDELGFFVLAVMAVHFAAALVTSPLFEEPGWRGFALGNLQRRFGREAGSLIVGTLWWVWHQPMNLSFGIQPTIYGFLSMVTYSFMIDSLFNLSGKNLFTAMLAHQSLGTLNIFIYEGDENVLTLVLLIGLAGLLRFLERKNASVKKDVYL